MAQPHDAFFKTVFSDPKSAGIELAHILGPNLAGLVRLDQLTLESASFVDPSLRHRQSDLLFKTTLTNQKPLLVYILVEHQSTSDRWMPFRLLCYMVNIWQNARKQEPEQKSLPLILPVVFYQGKQPWRAVGFSELLGLSKEEEKAVWGLHSKRLVPIRSAAGQRRKRLSSGRKCTDTVVVNAKHMGGRTPGVVFALGYKVGGGCVATAVCVYRIYITGPEV